MTLDLSSASSNLRPKKKRRTAAPEQTPIASTSVANGSDVTVSTAAGPTELDAAPLDDLEEAQLAGNSFKDPEQGPESEDQIQILDFHSANPIVSYQDQIYSCEWTSTIGTDLLLTNPDPESQHPVLREAPGISVLGATGTKLFGRPAQINARPHANPKAASKGQIPTPETSSQAEEIRKATAVQIPSNLAPSRARLDQANFLERLIAAKAARGETDQVTVIAQRIAQGSGWRSQQKALAERRASEASEVDGAEDGTPKTGLRRTSQIGRPRSALRKRGIRTAKGGLFRDYRPQLWNTEGADIRNDSTRTPDSWDQIERGKASRQSSTTGATPSTSATPAPQLQQAAAINASGSALDVPGIATSGAQQTQSEQVTREGSQLADENSNGTSSGNDNGTVQKRADAEMQDV